MDQLNVHARKSKETSLKDRREKKTNTLVNFFLVVLFVRIKARFFKIVSYRLAWILFNRGTTIGIRMDQINRRILSNEHKTSRVENKDQYEEEEESRSI